MEVVKKANGRLRIDQCPSCKAVFLDEGELGALQLWQTLTGGD